MSLLALDPRQHAYAGKYANTALCARASAIEQAEYHFITAQTFRVTQGNLDILATPCTSATRTNQLWYGDLVDVFVHPDIADGWCWLQNQRDGYVGYAQQQGLSTFRKASLNDMDDYRVCVPMTPRFAAADIKSPIFDMLPLNSRFTPCRNDENDDTFWRLEHGGYIIRQHCRTSHATVPDPTTVLHTLAPGFVDTPYAWGGGTRKGLDCSGLVQTLYAAIDITLPRDSDQQQQYGKDMNIDNMACGDLLFWRGHVGMMLDSAHLIHAHAHAMRVTIEPATDTLLRLRQQGLPLIASRRILD